MEIYNLLKGQINSLNIILILIVTGTILHKRKPRLSLWLLISGLILALCFSTAYIPEYLVSKKETRYNYFKQSDLTSDDTVHILVLGGGYTFDSRLSTLAQLSESSMARLTEGVRILNLVKKSKLICSGPATSGTQSLASVYKQSAIMLGVDPRSVSELDSAMTTMEEAEYFKRDFGTGVQVVLVTDAIHMDRALETFLSVGIRPVPAPAYFYVKNPSSLSEGKFLPSLRNMEMMDRIIHEFLGNVKRHFF